MFVFITTSSGEQLKAYLWYPEAYLYGDVDKKFGQAEFDDGGAGMIIQVRCDQENKLKKGSQALIVSYDDRREAFIIEPYDKRMNIPSILEGPYRNSIAPPRRTNQEMLNERVVSIFGRNPDGRTDRRIRRADNGRTVRHQDATR